MAKLQGLKPESVFYYFEEICKIPHGSSNTKKISDYCVAFADKYNLECYQDKWNNIVIKKPGSKGYESSEPVILQGHLDMVCVKGTESSIDFENDGLDLRVDGDEVYAFDTTLGGDDGIAVAYALAVLSDDSLMHPPLEVLFTVDEETGMEGATNFDASILSGKRLLNIDSELEGTFLTSCAGGAKVLGSLPIEWERRSGELYKITVAELLGGHSGVEIDKNRGNAIVILGRILQFLSEKIELGILEIRGGTKDNAIPVNAMVEFIMDEKYEDDLYSLVGEIKQILKAELKVSDPNINVILCPKGYYRNPVFTKATMDKLITILRLAPNGMLRMSSDIKGLVESSNNLGVITMDREFISFDFGVRSSVETSKADIVEQLKILFAMVNGTINIQSEYPAWEYKEESDLRAILKQAYIDMYCNEPVIEAIHAGLECGILSNKIDNLDCISFGPDIEDIHTTQERLSISSTQRVWDFIVEVLKRLK